MRTLIFLIWDKLLTLLPGVHPLPRILQFPITGVCNSACVTCSVPSRAPNVELTPERVAEILQNNLFRKLESVGINGGEPTLVKDLPKIVTEILKLPRLKSIYMISNGTLTGRLLASAKDIQSQCVAKGVHFSLSLSLDGVGVTYRACRGIAGFEAVMASVTSILSSPKIYCSEFSVGCTVSKYNVNHLVELEAFCKENQIPAFFRLAVPNKRIHNLHYADRFSVFSSESSKMAAQEFFFHKIMDKNEFSLKRKLKYFAIFQYILSGGNVRLSGCFWQWRDATVDEKGNLYYCATQSKRLGTINGDNASSIFFDKDNLSYRDDLVEEHCQKCIHYAFLPNTAGLFNLLKLYLKLFFFPVRYQMMRWLY